MNVPISAIDTEQIMSIYQQLNVELKQQLIAGAPWEDLRDKVEYINELSKELSRRKITVNSYGSTPADFQFRSE
jgi:hypothetical protein